MAHPKPADVSKQARRSLTAKPANTSSDFPFEASPKASADARLYLAAMNHFFSSFSSNRHRKDANE